MRTWSVRLWPAALGSFAALLLLLAIACGDDDDTAAPTSTPEPTTEGSPTPTGETPTPTEPNGDGSPTPTLAPSQTEAGIGLREFAVQPRRTSARPGTVTFNVQNNGEISHEFVVVRTDLPHAQLPRLDNNEGVDESQVEIVGRIDRLDRGETASLTLDLESANYVLICNFYTDSTSHYLRGMYDRFVISEDAPPPDDAAE